MLDGDVYSAGFSSSFIDVPIFWLLDVKNDPCTMSKKDFQSKTFSDSIKHQHSEITRVLSPAGLTWQAFCFETA